MNFTIQEKEQQCTQHLSHQNQTAKKFTHQTQQINPSISNIEVNQKTPNANQNTGLFVISSFENYFKVSQEEVLQRIKLSFNPLQKDFIEKTNKNPDLYGPFWILTTLIFLLGSTGNIANYFLNWSTTQFIFKLQLIRDGVIIIYPFGFGIPTLIHYICKLMGMNNLQLPNIICLYGYSFTCFIPIFMLCIIPNSIVTWFLVIYGMVNTVWFLIGNIVEYLEDMQQSKKYVILGIIGVAQMALCLTLKFLFFQLVYVGEVQTDS